MPAYDDIKRQVERRYRRVTFFILHVILAITIVGVVWAIKPNPGEGTIVMGALWAGLLIFHAFKLWLDNERDHEIERTWAKYAPTAIYEKPKRHSRLSDDEFDSDSEVRDDQAARLQESDIRVR